MSKLPPNLPPHLQSAIDDINIALADRLLYPRSGPSWDAVRAALLGFAEDREAGLLAAKERDELRAKLAEAEEALRRERHEKAGDYFQGAVDGCADRKKLVARVDALECALAAQRAQTEEARRERNQHFLRASRVEDLERELGKANERADRLGRKSAAFASALDFEKEKTKALEAKLAERPENAELLKVHREAQEAVDRLIRKLESKDGGRL